MRLVIVYIEEAHASDEWPISSSRANPCGGVVDVAQPKTEAERCAVASHFRDLFELGRIPMVIDTMNNAYAQLYAPWPLRFHVVDRDGRLALVTEPVNARFDFSQVRDALLACLA